MIKIALPEKPGSWATVILGLSHENLDRLRGGKPIRLDVDQCASLGLGHRELVIYAGEDEVTLTAQLEERGLIGKGATERLRDELGPPRAGLNYR